MFLLMSSRKFQLPEPVRMRAESLGEPGRRWMAGLNETIKYLETLWSIRVGEVLSGGTESLVANVLLDDGEPAVLKVGLPGSSDLAKEAQIFRLAAGRGYATLIADDPSTNALLVEKLGRPLEKKITSIEKQIRIICAMLREAWIPLDASHGLMTGAEKARWLADFIVERWAMLDQPCSRRVVDRALSFAAEREAAFSSESSVLVHGDAHALNALAVLTTDGRDSGQFKFVDPDGLFAEPACDLAVPMRDWSAELLSGPTVALARERCELLADLTGVDTQAIWQWGFVERVSTGLVELEIGMKEGGAVTLAAAERLVDV